MISRDRATFGTTINDDTSIEMKDFLSQNDDVPPSTPPYIQRERINDANSISNLRSPPPTQMQLDKQHAGKDGSSVWIIGDTIAEEGIAEEDDKETRRKTDNIKTDHDKRMSRKTTDAGNKFQSPQSSMQETQNFFCGPDRQNKIKISIRVKTPETRNSDFQS